MIVVLKNGAPEAQVNELKAGLRARGLDLHESKGADVTILGLIGDTSHITPEELLANEIVERFNSNLVSNLLSNKYFLL